MKRHRLVFKASLSRRLRLEELGRRFWACNKISYWLVPNWKQPDLKTRQKLANLSQ